LFPKAGFGYYWREMGDARHQDFQKETCCLNHRQKE
jgi:hypothetical protein